jgi:hypothetical protein
MPEYFDCMRCGHMSVIAAKPPKCPKCGSGAGVIVTRSESPGEGAARDASPPKKEPGSKQ